MNTIQSTNIEEPTIALVTSSSGTQNTCQPSCQPICQPSYGPCGPDSICAPDVSCKPK